MKSYGLNKTMKKLTTLCKSILKNEDDLRERIIMRVRVMVRVGVVVRVE